ncbi:MAG TPA: hypothetical protein VF317_06275 [Dermatophilaceae bacterium]
MSNRRRLKPPPVAVQAFAAEARCPDCGSYVGEPDIDEYGIWHLTMHHDDECPFYRGVTR